MYISSISKLLFTICISVINLGNINGGDVQRKNVVNNVDKSSLWTP